MIRRSLPRFSSALAISLAFLGGTLLDGSLSSLRAELLVNWGGEYVTNSQPFQGVYTFENGLNLGGDLNIDDSRFGYSYNDLAPTPLSPASGYSGTSDTFYGGFSANKFDAVSGAADLLQPNAQGVHQSGTADHIKLQTQHSSNHDHTFAMLTYWDKADFLNQGSLPTNTVTLDNASQFSFTTRNSSNIQDEIHLHFVIRDGNQFYVSEAYWGGTNLADPDRLGDFPDGSTVTYNPFASPLGWQAYNPSGLNLQFSHAGPYDAASSFNNITGFGFYVDTLTPNRNNSNLEIEGFSMTGVVVVPEPSSALSLLGLVAGSFFLRRRRRLA